MIETTLMKFCSEELMNPVIAQNFCAYAADADPQAWLKFAAKHGRTPDDPVLAMQATIQLLHLVSAALIAERDRLSAVIETRSILGLDP